LSYKKGYCNPHYIRNRRWGDPLGSKPKKPWKPERLWSRVDKNGPVPDYRPDVGPCWLWTGVTSGGYGQIRVAGRMRPTHCVAYELLVGPIPEGLELDHLCRVRNCCRVSHLEPVSHKENALRGVGCGAVNAAKTHCKQGHPLFGDTVIITAKERKCRECYARWNREYRARKKAAG
jgi:hypothetical protein